MELHAYTKTISELFSVKKQYIVPRFQRPYSWDKDKVSELWDDIVSNISINDDNTFSYEEYFIGSLVLVGDDKSVKMQIVDGQQRLTTLTILLSTLCQRFLEIDKKNIAESIYENYIAGKDDDGNYYFKLENETPKPFFQTVIQDINKVSKKQCLPSSEEEQTLLNSYDEFYSYTSKTSLKQKFKKYRLDESLYENLLKAIRDQVVTYLKVIFITVKEEDDAYTIFETLNARGMDLTFVDLIKNKVFKSSTTTHPDDFTKTKWTNLRNIIDSRDDVGSLEIFVRHWWISKYDYTSKDNIYKHFKKRWNSGEIGENFLDELVNDAKLYMKISSPVTEDFKQQEEKDLYKSLVALKIFNVSQQKPFILSLFKTLENKKITLAQVKDILTFIEKFHFSLNAICSLGSLGIERSYSTAARELLKANNKRQSNQVLKELKQRFEPRIPARSTFVENFSRLKYTSKEPKHKKLIQYIFSYIESRKQTTNEFKPNSMTLEHILPQSYKKDKEFVASIGNLLPLGQKLNEEAADKDVHKKIEIYKKSNFALTQEFAQTPPQKWGKEEIRKRTNDLAEYCYNSMWNNSNP
ncbi:DUF262 domain-containing HNH endonuclease family protein [Okeania sp.]|uniref:DUF262 domain-containing protein n=1 Tax=Okeania sp. TaxID=3100323 RepID=UPI002B4AFC42|nr:DUF262 domain-containing HNH endonuclease family protein [Okeania sp.]MEB3342621.1 DUF262 domain-containing HNH endonuclease family protein [Okeania sp.]